VLLLGGNNLVRQQQAQSNQKKKGENRMMIDYSQIDVFVFLFCSSSPYEDVFLEYTDR
jgi:hypothetical protein